MRLDDGTLQQLIAQLRHDEPIKRWEAADALRQAREERAVSPLLGALHDPSDSVRHTAAMALGELGEVAFLDLQTCLADERWEVREAAIMALGASMYGRAYPSPAPRSATR